MRREAFERLQTTCLTGGLIRKRVSFEECTDMRIAKQVAAEDPPSI